MLEEANDLEVKPVVPIKKPEGKEEKVEKDNEVVVQIRGKEWKLWLQAGPLGDMGDILMTGDIVYERHTSKKEGEWDWEKVIKYNEGHLPVEEIGQDLAEWSHGNAWRKEFYYREDLGHERTPNLNPRNMLPEREEGEITGGSEEGHKWIKYFSREHRDTNEIVIIEKGEITARGRAGWKEPKGHKWVKETYYAEPYAEQTNFNSLREVYIK